MTTSESPARDTVVSGDASQATEAATVGPAHEGAAARLPRTGELIGRYVVLDVIGTGGMGVVLSAYDPQLDRKVALKLVRPGRSRDTDEIEREARIVAKLHHPNLVVVHDVGTTEAGVFLAMEFLEGTTLRVFQARGLRLREIVAVYAKAGRGLAAVHDADVVHGDFKPDNVFVVGQAREVKLLDFGIAHAGPPPEVSSTASQPAATPRGTAGYLAPELWHGASPSSASDQFAFCVALFEALTGGRPHAISTLVAKPGPSDATTPLPWTKTVPGWLRRVVARGLSLDASRRAASMHELVDELVAGPRRARTRIVFAAASTILAAGVIAGAVRGDPCRAAADAVHAHWADGREERVRTSIDQRYGAGTYEGLAPKVDAVMADVATGAQRLCQTRGRDPDLDARRERCVESGFAEQEALEGLAGGSDAEQQAAATWIGLGRMTPLGCGDDDALRWRPAAAPGLVESGELRDLSRRGFRIEMLGLTDGRAAFDEAQLLVEEVRSADPVLHARALIAMSVAPTEQGDLAEAGRMLRRALEAAELAESPADVALVWLYLAQNVVQLNGSEQIQDLAFDRARAIADRVGLAEVDLALLRQKARLLDRDGDNAGAAEQLGQLVALAHRDGRTLSEVGAQTMLVTYLLRAARPAEALIVAREAMTQLDNPFLPSRERVGVIGSLAAALAANELIDEADVATTRALELAASPDGRVTPLQAALACNWCQGVGVTCRTDRIPGACKRCVETSRQISDATQGALSGLYLAFAWMADTKVGGGAQEARATLDALEGRPEWDDGRADAAYALITTDPGRALEVALDVCDAKGLAECTSRAAYVIARLHPDRERRAAADRRLWDLWQTLDEHDKVQSLGIGLHLAKAGLLAREGFAPVIEQRQLPCLTAWPEVDAWWRAGEPGAAATVAAAALPQ